MSLLENISACQGNLSSVTNVMQTIGILTKRLLHRRISLKLKSDFRKALSILPINYAALAVMILRNGTHLAAIVMAPRQILDDIAYI